MTGLPPELGRRERAPLVGRADELATLLAAWRRARAGDRKLVLVAGEPGIGKTRLAAEAAASAHDDGALVLHGRCDPEAVFPYQPFAQALPPGTTDDPFTVGLDRAALFGTYTALLRQAAGEQPVVLVLDDIHWATAPSLALLRHVFRALLTTPVLLVATYRDTEVERPGPLADMLADLRVERGIERVALHGLDADGVGALVDALVEPGAVTDRGRLVANLIDDTGGNPFFVEEVLRDVSATAMPPSVRDVLAVRLGRLPGVTRQHLAAAAVIGPTFDLGLLDALELGGDAIDAVEPAVHTRLVVEDQMPSRGRVRFAHALIRQALLDELGATRAARLHARVAAALETTGGAPAEVASHYLASGRVDLVERGARAALDAAAAVAWRSAPEAAAAITAAAITALDAHDSNDDALRVRLLCEQAEALLVLQRSFEFLAVTERAVDLARATGSTELFALAVGTRGCYTPAGHTDEAFITDIQDALAVIDDDQIALRARLHGGLALSLLLMGRERQAVIEHAGIGAALGDQVGDLFVRWIPRFAGALAGCGEPDMTIQARFGEELLAVGAEHEDENATCHGLRATGLARLAGGDLDGYLATMADAAERWALIGNRWGYAAGIQARYTGAAARGQWDVAEAALDELLAFGATDPTIAVLYVGEVIMLRELQGRLAEIDSMLAASAAAYPAILSLAVVHGIHVHDTGDAAPAEAILRRTLADERFAFPDFTELSQRAWTTQLAAMCGAVDVLPALVSSLHRWQGQVLVVNAGVGILGAVDAYLALGHAALGDHDEAERLFASALALEESNRCVPFAERTRRWRDAMRSGA